MWLYTHFENDRLFRTNREQRCRRVHQNRSTWLVSPSPLPPGRCRLPGTTAAYAARKSVCTTAPSRYSAGSEFQNSMAVRSSRPPTNAPTTRRVSASSASHTHHRLPFEPTKLHSSSHSRISRLFFFAVSAVRVSAVRVSAERHPRGHRPSGRAQVRPDATASARGTGRWRIAAPTSGTVS